MVAVWAQNYAKLPSRHVYLVRLGILGRFKRKNGPQAYPQAVDQRSYFDSVSRIHHDDMCDADVNDLWVRHVDAFGVGYWNGASSAEAARLADRDALAHLSELRTLQRAFGREWRKMYEAWKARQEEEAEHGIDLARLDPQGQRTARSTPSMSDSDLAASRRSAARMIDSARTDSVTDRELQRTSSTRREHRRVRPLWLIGLALIAIVVIVELTTDSEPQSEVGIARERAAFSTTAAENDEDDFTVLDNYVIGAYNSAFDGWTHRYDSFLDDREELIDSWDQLSLIPNEAAVLARLGRMESETRHLLVEIDWLIAEADRMLELLGQMSFDTTEYAAPLTAEVEWLEEEASILTDDLVFFAEIREGG